MRVLRTIELPVVIRVETPQEVVVALPRSEPAEDVLTLASLVLSSEEFEELRDNLAAHPDTIETVDLGPVQHHPPWRSSDERAYR
jgi:hypothetical protein